MAEGHGDQPQPFLPHGGGREAVQDVSDEDLKRFPVESVSWNDAQFFAARVNELDPQPGWVYRLPLQVEWEYACRGGPMTDPAPSAYHYYFEEPTNQLQHGQANFREGKEGLNRTCKVGSYKPNGLGLYDMHGNVTEWCANLFADVNGSPVRMHRGGAWFFDVGRLRAAIPAYDSAAHSWGDNGLRLARVPAGEKGN